MNYFQGMIKKWKMILSIFFHKTKGRFFSRRHFFIFIKPEFIFQSINFSLVQYARDYFIIKKPWFWSIYSYLLLVFFFLFYYYGFLCFLEYLEQVWNLSQTSLLKVVALIIFLSILPSGNFLVSFVISFSYFFLIFLWWYNFRKNLDSTSFFVILLLLVLVIKPLWKFVVKAIFYTLFKKIYHHSWFQKALPHLSPNFDSSEVRGELKDWKDEDNS